MNKGTSSFFLIIFLIGAVGCAEYRGLQRTGGIPRDLNIGDKIQVTLKDDQHFEFVVVNITDQSIVGETCRYKIRRNPQHQEERN